MSWPPNSACRRSAQGHSGRPLASSSALAAFSNSRILRPIVTLSVVHRSPPLKFPSSEMASRTCSRTRRTSMQALRVRWLGFRDKKTIAELLYPACRSASISLRFGSPVAREYKKCRDHRAMISWLCALVLRCQLALFAAYRVLVSTARQGGGADREWFAVIRRVSRLAPSSSPQARSAAGRGSPTP